MSEEKLSKKEQREAAKQEKAAAKRQEEKAAALKKGLTAGGIVAIVVGIVVAVAVSAPGPGEYTSTYQEPTIGEEGLVLVEEFSDFQCPACAAAQPVVKDILEEYEGKIQFVYKDFPLPFHEYATDAAVGGQCALNQDLFFPYHDLVFENQAEWSDLRSRGDAQDQFRAYAEEVGVELAAFDECVSGNDAAAAVNENIAEGNARGVNATPTFLVNGEKVSTDQPYSVALREAIDAALDEEDSGETE